MRSIDRSKALDLERDLPTTPADVAALRRARAHDPIDLETYLRFLAQLPPPPPGALRARRLPKGDPPFRL